MDFSFGLGEIGAAGINAAASAVSQRMQYQYNLKLQQQAQQWQERMSNTAHQREVKDLRSAGLNPILSATGGSGASTGSVGASSVGLAQIDPVSSAIAWKQSKNDTKVKESQIDLNNNTTNKIIHEADLAHYSAAYAREQTQLLQDFGAEKMKAEIAQINSGTAKNYQDMLNSISFTNAQIKNLDSNTAKSLKEAGAITKRTGAGLVIPKFGELGYYTQN